MYVDRFPRFLQSSFSRYRKHFSLIGFKHFRILVLALVINGRKGKLIHLARAVPTHGHRTSHAKFLLSDWQASAVIASRAWDVIASMKPQRGESIYLVIDDTRIKKRGKKMQGVSKVWDQKSHAFFHGHIVVMAAILFRGVTIPWAVDLWIPKKQAKKSYRKLTHIAASMINAFSSPWELKVRVLFDSAYLAPPLIRACESRGFAWYSVAARNRKVTRNGKKQALQDIAPGILRYSGKRVRMPRSRGWRWLRIASVDGELGKTGSVRLVFSKRSSQSDRKLLCVATNELTQAPREVIAIYEKRWSIEVLFKELRTSLGLCDYQVLSRIAIVRYLHLCCASHQMLTHQAVQDEGAKAHEKNKEVVLPSLIHRIELFRQKVNNDRIAALLSRIKDKKLKRKIRRYLICEAPVAA